MSALAAFFVTSCSDSFLEVENNTDYPVEDYYKTQKHLDEALVSAYAPLHWYDYGTTYQYNALHYTDFLADDLLPNGSSNTDQPTLQAMHSYSDLSSLMVPTGYWGDSFSGIKRANDALKYADWTEEAGNITAAEKLDYVSQLRVLRAFYYNVVWKLYGNIPCYFTNLEAPYIDEQLSADDVYAKVVADLEDVIDNGALKDDYADEEKGHVTKAMAQMLYTEMVMIQADQTRYSKALGYLNSIITSGQYDLVSDFSSIWAESGEWGKESIFEINYFSVNSGRAWDNRLAAGGNVMSRLCGPRDFTPGTGCDVEAGWGFAAIPAESAALFTNNDRRKAITVFDMEANGTVTSGGGGWQYTGYMLGKYVGRVGGNKDVTGASDMGFNNNERVYRYAETLLYAAELELKANNNGAKAAEYVNKVRNRAGLASLPTVTEDDIIKERRLEFMGEGKRFFDLVRTGKAASVLKQNQYRKKDWSEQYRYLPIPQDNIDAAKGTMQQNFGY